jgi:hypothetical protein
LADAADLEVDHQQYRLDHLKVKSSTSIYGVQDLDLRMAVTNVNVSNSRRL